MFGVHNQHQFTISHNSCLLHLLHPPTPSVLGGSRYFLIFARPLRHMLCCAGRHGPRRPGCPGCPGCLAVESLALVTSGNMLWAMLWARHIETSHTNHINFYAGYDYIDNRSNANICDVYFGTIRWMVWKYTLLLIQNEDCRDSAPMYT